MPCRWRASARECAFLFSRAVALREGCRGRVSSRQGVGPLRLNRPTHRAHARGYPHVPLHPANAGRRSDGAVCSVVQVYHMFRNCTMHIAVEVSAAYGQFRETYRARRMCKSHAPIILHYSAACATCTLDPAVFPALACAGERAQRRLHKRARLSLFRLLATIQRRPSALTAPAVRSTADGATARDGLRVGTAR
eukprot:IDg2531t1